MAEAEMFPLRARGVSVSLGGHRALDDVSLEIGARARTAVLGANGAGKSVLLRVLHGLIAPDAGSVAWGESGRRPAQAMVFQRPVLLRRPALANIEYALAVNGVRGDERRDRALEAIGRVGLSHLAGRQARRARLGRRRGRRGASARPWGWGGGLFGIRPSAARRGCVLGHRARIAGSLTCHAPAAAAAAPGRPAAAANRRLIAESIPEIGRDGPGAWTPQSGSFGPVAAPRAGGQTAPRPRSVE